MNNQQLDTLLGLYLLASQHRGEPQYAPLEAGLIAGLVVSPTAHYCDPAAHRLELSRCDKRPTLADWQAVELAMPYALSVMPQVLSHAGLHVLQATYNVLTCACGCPRAQVGGLLLECRRCRARRVMIGNGAEVRL